MTSLQRRMFAFIVKVTDGGNHMYNVSIFLAHSHLYEYDTNIVAISVELTYNSTFRFNSTMNEIRNT